MERVFYGWAQGAAWLLFAAGAAVCWWLTVVMAVDFSASADAAVMWRSAAFAPLFLMWGVMMAAMMLPSFVPTARCFSLLLERRRLSRRVAAGRWLALVGGYLLLWLLFSAGAALLQLVAASSLGASLAFEEPVLRALLLAAAGVFQFSRLKQRCLHGCRHPAFFFLLHWRGGGGGAFVMGAHNGLLCVGCCLWLMLLLFVGGVMELSWILALALYVLAEKVLPHPRLLSRVAGGVLLLMAAAQFLYPIGGVNGIFN